MSTNSKAFVEERRDRIFELITRNQRVTISELAEKLNCSDAMIRRDLASMETKGLIRRTHGGAIPVEATLLEADLKIRNNSHREEKLNIAQRIAKYIRSGDALMIDGGSTMHILAKQLRSIPNLTVLTNSPDVAKELVGINKNRVIMTGGELMPLTNILVGPPSIRTIKGFRADKAILGMSSMLIDDGFFTVNQYEAEVKVAMIESAKEVIVGLDSSKIGVITFSFVCGFSSVHRLITDKGISSEHFKVLSDKGLLVEIAE